MTDLEISDCESEVFDQEELPVAYGGEEELGVDGGIGNDPVYVPPSLNGPPDFTPLSLNTRQDIMLFISNSEFETFAKNINSYAELKGATSTTSNTSKKPRPWFPTTANELMVWFGLLIFMGLVKTGAKDSRVDVYWRKSMKFESYATYGTGTIPTA